MGSLSLDEFSELSKPSFVTDLEEDSDARANAPNKQSRQVFSGHYVLVKPDALANPVLVHYSKSLATELGLSDETCLSDKFRRFFSGDVDAVAGFKESWSTPYALSIYGQTMYDNCPFGTGNGYGDGRAISVAQVTLANGRGYEFQLKGAGTTPFSRSADGKAVLRSSVREFLASEFMYHAGVSTTRALSLVASQTQKVMRPWYSNKAREVSIPNVESIPEQFRKVLVAQYMARFKDPDVMRPEACAITCRVATSFIRVGHFELFARRIAGPRCFPKGSAKWQVAKKQLELLVKHAVSREFPQIEVSKTPSTESDDELYLEFLRECSARMAVLTANWIRVGYCQGNFNSDNCLVAGRTMDFGPFGFIERFTPLWNMWSGGGEHFGFLNQPVAGAKNFETLVESILPIITSATRKEEATALIAQHLALARRKEDEMWASKLGFSKSTEALMEKILNPLLNLMTKHPIDYAMFWRQLSEVALLSNANDAELLEPLQQCFWKPPPGEIETLWINWIKNWKEELADPPSASRRMKTTSPKYVPREFMLVNAYSKAIEGDYSEVKQLLHLFESPYDEHPDLEERYYQKVPMDAYEGIGIGGVSHMS